MAGAVGGVASTDGVTKVMVLLQPLPDALERCERYYTDVHVRLIRRTLRDDPRWLSYYQDRFIRQYDADGGFRREPDRWRMVLLRGVTEPFQSGTAQRPNNSELQRVIELDHQNFVGDLARLEVEEGQLHNSLGQQVALQKYTVIFRRSDNDAEADGAAFSAAARQLAGLAKSAPGLRLALANRVLGELDNAFVGASLVPIPRYRPQPSVSGILELWFDNRFSGEDFFALGATMEQLHFGALPAEAYTVLQTAGFDKRNLEPGDLASI